MLEDTKDLPFEHVVLRNSSGRKLKNSHHFSDGEEVSVIVNMKGGCGAGGGCDCCGCGAGGDVGCTLL